MRTIRKFGLELKISLSRVKRIIISIPDAADDTWYHNETRTIRYFTYGDGLNVHHIELPTHSKVEVISCSKKYNKTRTGYAENRVIVIDLYK